MTKIVIVEERDMLPKLMRIWTASKGGKNVEKVRYMISDAANIVNVESHVLRYWEEELDLQIPRNEMGHRYYTEDNIAQFQKIKEWKEQGYQLKAIRIMIHNGGECPEPEPVPVPLVKTEVCKMPDTAMAPKRQDNSALNTIKLEQFQSVMLNIVKRAVEENNQALGKEVSSQVGEKVLKEMNYLMREQDEAAEERFRKLDAAIRTRQKGKMFRKEKPKKESGKEKKLKPNLTT